MRIALTALGLVCMVAAVAFAAGAVTLDEGLYEFTPDDTFVPVPAAPPSNMPPPGPYEAEVDEEGQLGCNGMYYTPEPNSTWGTVYSSIFHFWTLITFDDGTYWEMGWTPPNVWHLSSKGTYKKK